MPRRDIQNHEDIQHALARARATARSVRAYWARQGQYAGGRHIISATGEGIQWADIRAYQYGDEVKWISWRHSARTPAETWIKTFEQERAHRFVIMLDRSASMARGILQNRYRRAWWMASLMGYLVLKNQDLCAVYESDAPLERLAFVHLRDDNHMTRWALAAADPERRGLNPDPLHIQLIKLRQRLRRFTSILVFTDGYDDFEALGRALKEVSRTHEIMVVLFPDLFHISRQMCDETRKHKWRFHCYDDEKKQGFISEVKNVSAEWLRFWSGHRFARVSAAVCRPDDDPVKFIQRVLRGGARR